MALENSMEPATPQTPHVPKAIHLLPPQTSNPFEFSTPHQGNTIPMVTKKQFQSLGVLLPALIPSQLAKSLRPSFLPPRLPFAPFQLIRQHFHSSQGYYGTYRSALRFTRDGPLLCPPKVAAAL